MGFSAKVLADSVSPDGVRLTTLSVVYPRIIHGEMLRHRMFSRCAASSRAIPIQRFVQQVEEDPYIPTHWGSNQAGMQAGDELEGEARELAITEWRAAARTATYHAGVFERMGVHKQITNRILEPWMWTCEVITATEWENFFHLRVHPAAHPEIQRIATLMQEAIRDSDPVQVSRGEWHLPLIQDADYERFILRDPTAPVRVIENLKMVSVGRCARVSYWKHEGAQDADADVERASKMLAAGHMSPFEHVARPMYVEEGGGRRRNFSGNFRGWVQYRKELPNEADPLGAATLPG